MFATTEQRSPTDRKALYFLIGLFAICILTNVLSYKTPKKDFDFISISRPSNNDDDRFKSSNKPMNDEVKQAALIIIFKLLASILASAIFSFVILVLFRYVMKQIMWGIYIGIVVILFSISIYAFTMASTVEDKNVSDNPFIQGGLFFGILGIVYIILLYIFRTRIQLTIAIFKEASKVLQDHLQLLIQPVITAIEIIIISGFFGYLLLVGISNKLTIDEESLIDDIALTLTGFTFYCMLNLIYGIQHFLIASTVCQWYFTRDKTKLHAPIRTAYSHLKIHFGTICFGGILMTIVQYITAFLRKVLKTMLYCCCLCCVVEYMITQIEKIFGYLMRNAYIVVALKGTPMIASSKKTASLMKTHLADVYAVNKFGDFVMFLTRVFVAVFTGLLCYSLVAPPGDSGHLEGPLLAAFIAGFFGFIIVHIFMTVFEMSVDTIFLCYCFDSEENDGIRQEYFMSPKLRKAMENIKSHGKQTNGGAYVDGKDFQLVQPLNPMPNAPSEKNGYNV